MAEIKHRSTFLVRKFLGFVRCIIIIIIIIIIIGAIFTNVCSG